MVIYTPVRVKQVIGDRRYGHYGMPGYEQTGCYAAAHQSKPHHPYRNVFYIHIKKYHYFPDKAGAFARIIL